ncbi:hypothetical protein CDEST_09481 [Colletotrichum destructivum]|uniref:Uncharacterized protein n=1 Tax=Colletotrichum destructivum TaxID=34406 RepID=A0AAX4IMK3_9PEZI|nr:hypothetical protein CDEST_09481 [Colletotrichum destructivum]
MIKVLPGRIQCLAAGESSTAVCGWENKCVAIGTNGLPTPSTNVCSAGRKFVTYAKDSPVVGACKGDEKVNSWVPYCCDQDVDMSSFKWSGVAGTAGDGSDKCNDAKICLLGKTSIATSYLGAGKDYVKRTFCADPNALRRTIKTLPVPLENIFPHPGPDKDEQKWQVELEPTMGSAGPTPEESTNADKNSFGWYIMSGPRAELASLDKRDGSHWELFDCEPSANHEGRQTVRAMCTDSSYMSNCGVIHEGRGVVGTVIEMPAGCGPGKHAMAVSLEPSRNQSLPRRLEKRADELADSPIFDLTKYELVRHTVNEQSRWNIHDESVSCNIKGVDTTGYFTAWADLNVNIQCFSLNFQTPSNRSSVKERARLFQN